MAEVARRAGVSLSTVSRALAGSPLISEATRKAVRTAAEQLDYRVDAAGSSLRTGLTRTIGVVIPLSHAANQGFSDPFFLEILGAVADELSACGYNMLLAKVTDDPCDWIMLAMKGMNRAVPPPNPAAMMPDARPRFSVNHLSAEPMHPP